jgi:hypothetical protein
MAAAESDRTAQSRLALSREELQKLGWADIMMDTRYFSSSDAETLQRYAKELVALQPDLILSQSTSTRRLRPVRSALSGGACSGISQILRFGRRLVASRTFDQRKVRSDRLTPSNAY